MPWPKGQKRIGYVRKDGKAHAKKGERVKTHDIEKHKAARVIKMAAPKVATQPTEKKPVWGLGSRAAVEVCPNCSFAYADGGYCPECGWTTWRGKGNK